MINIDTDIRQVKNTVSVTQYRLSSWLGSLLALLVQWSTRCTPTSEQGQWTWPSAVWARSRCIDSSGRASAADAPASAAERPSTCGSDRSTHHTHIRTRRVTSAQQPVFFVLFSNAFLYVSYISTIIIITYRYRYAINASKKSTKGDRPERQVYYTITQQELSSCWDGRPFDHNRHGPKVGRGCCRGRSPLGHHLT